MRRAGQLAAELLALAQELVVPGISTGELDRLIAKYTAEKGAISAPLNYHGFPKSICTSVNNVICHGIPNDKQILQDGDIINVDVTPIVDGYHGDASKTFLVGKSHPQSTLDLVACANACLEIGINQVAKGNRIGDIGAAIQRYAEGLGFSVVREFVGHGIGKEFHEDPQIPHYGKAGTGRKFSPGMVFTIEPMINQGDWRSKTLADGWTAVTMDGKLSAQFEHTIAIRSDWTVEILTR